MILTLRNITLGLVILSSNLAPANSFLAGCDALFREIEAEYGRVPIHIGIGNELKIPYNHWVFQYWRSRAPSQIPDSAFAYYFLSHEQKLRWISQEAAKAPS